MPSAAPWPRCDTDTTPDCTDVHRDTGVRWHQEQTTTWHLATVRTPAVARGTAMASTTLGVAKPAKVHSKAPHDKVLKELPLMRALNKEASKTPTRTDSVDQVNRTRQANRTLVLTNKPNQTIKTPRTNNHSNSQQMTVHINLSSRVLRNNTLLPTRPTTVAIKATLRLRTANKARTKRRVHCMAMPTTPTSSVHSKRKTKGTRATMALLVTQAAQRKTSRLP